MKKMQNFEDCLDEIKYRYINDENVRKPLKDFENTIVITCLKEEHSFMMKINNKIDIVIKDHVEIADPPILIHLADEKILIDLLNKDLGPLTAYSSGKIKIIKGDKRLLVKLRKLLF